MTAQQIKDSTLTPHTIIPAQGAGTFVVPTMYVFNFQAGATPYVEGPIELIYGDLNLNALTSNTFIGSVDYLLWTSGAISAGFSEGGDPADYLNQPVRLRAGLRGEIVEAWAGATGATDYAIGDTGTVDDGSPNATYVITAVGAGGSVPAGNTGSIEITGGGGGYSLAAAGSRSEGWLTTPGGAQPGIGSGLTVDVVSVDASASAGDGTLQGVVYYTIADLS